MTRGLCSAHYQVFIRHLRKITPEFKEAFKDELIEKSMLLPVAKTGRKRKTEDPFADVAAKYKIRSQRKVPRLRVAEDGQDYDAEIQAKEDEIAGGKKRKLKKGATKKKTGK